MNTITFQKDLNLSIQGRQASVLFDVLTTESFSGSLKGLFNVTNMSDVFTSVQVKQGEITTDITELTGNSFVIPQDYVLETPVTYELIVETVESYEGDVTLTISTIQDDLENGTDEATIKVLSIDSALRQYEDKIAKLSTEDADTLLSEYAVLDGYRVMVLASINALESGQTKTDFLDRYKVSATSQYTAFKLLLTHASTESYLNVISVKNVAGTRPFMFTFMEKHKLTDATEAYLFQPSNESLEINNVPIAFGSQLTDETKFTLDTQPVGESVIFVKFADGIKKLYVTFDETGVTKYNDTTIALPAQGDIFNTPTHQAMLDLGTNSTLTTSYEKSVYDKDEKIVLNIGANYVVGAVPSEYLRKYRITSALFNTGTTISVFTALDRETPIKQITVAEKVDFIDLDPVVINANVGEENLVVEIGNVTYVGTANTDVTVLASQPDYVFGYTVKTSVSALEVIDRRAALDHAIANTTITYTGDVIQSTEDTINIITETVYPTFLPALDPELKVDTLLTTTETLNAGAVISLKANEVVIGTLTLEAPTNKVWLTEIVGEATLRDNLVNKTGQTITYEILVSNLESKKYGAKVSVITAKDDTFETNAHTLAYVDINMEVVEKTELATLITSAEVLLGRVAVGSEPGQAPQIAIDTFTAAIATAKAVKDDNDSTLTMVANGIIDLTNAMVEFRTFVVKITIDKSTLLASITEARSMHTSVQVGTTVGTVKEQQSKDDLMTAIVLAETRYAELPNEIDSLDEDDNTQALVDAEDVAMKLAITVFTALIITDVSYTEEKLTQYEISALSFLEAVRKKINI